MITTERLHTLAEQASSYASHLRCRGAVRGKVRIELTAWLYGLAELLRAETQERRTEKELTDG